MADRVVVTKVDDIDGSERNVVAVSFGYEGVTYSIDLSAKNKKRLDEALAEFIAHAKREGGRKRSGSAAAARAPKEKLAEIREWARASGYEVSDRGRISGVIQEAYAAAH